MSGGIRLSQSVFKIEVFNALQMWFGPSNIYLSQTNPSKHNPEFKMKTSLEVLNIIYLPQEPTSVGHCTTRRGVKWLITIFSHCTKNMYHIIQAQSLIWLLGFISIFLDWRLGFEPTLQPKGLNFRASKWKSCATSWPLLPMHLQELAP